MNDQGVTRRQQCKGSGVDSGSNSSARCLKSALMSMSVPALVKTCHDSCHEPNFASDGSPFSLSSSSAEEEGDDEASDEEDEGQVVMNSEEEVERQLEPDSDSDVSGSEKEVMGLGEGMRQDGGVMQQNSTRTVRQALKIRQHSGGHVRHEFIQSLLAQSPDNSDTLRLPINALLKAGSRRSLGVLLRPGETYRGKKISFSRLV